MATYYSYDDIHKIDAWQDNNITLMLTQGEGLDGETGSNTCVKRPTFQLKDERGIISIPTTGARLELAFTRRDGTTGSLGSNEITTSDGENGIVSFTVKPNLTSVVGKVKGEIRLITSNAVIKFYGVNFWVNKGVSNQDAIDSVEFDDLTKAFQELVRITPEGTAVLDALDENGELPINGTNPVASGNLKTYLEGKYTRYRTIYQSELNDVDTHLDSQTVYRFAGQGIILAANDSDKEAQYYFTQDGGLRYRYRRKINGEWEEWGTQFTTLETQANKTTDINSSSTNSQYPTAKAVYDSYVTKLENQVLFKNAVDLSAVTQWDITGFIDLSESSISIPAVVSSSQNYRCAVIDVSEYDYAILNGTGGAVSRLYAWVTPSGSIVDKSDENTTVSNTVITKPRPDIKYLVINDKKTGGICYVGKKFSMSDRSGEWETGLVSNYDGVMIDNAKTSSTINARQKAPMYTGNVDQLSITPKSGIIIGARCFDAWGVMIHSITKQNSPFTINCHANGYYYVWLFGSFSSNPVGTDFTDSENIYLVSNGFSINTTPIINLDFGLVNTTNAVKNWVSGRFVNLGNSSSVIPPVETSKNFRYSVNVISEGDYVLLNCKGGVGSRAYAFLDANQSIIEMAPASAQYHAAVFVAPHNARYLVINDKEKLYDSYIIRQNNDDKRSIIHGLNLLRNNIDTRFGIVSTYLQQLNSVYSDQRVNRDNDTITFAWISDLHQGYYSHGGTTYDGSNAIKLLNYLAQLCSADFVLNSGDITYDSDNSCIDYFKKQSYVEDIPVIVSVGNHDTANNQPAILKYAGDLARMSTNAVGHTNGLNFYFDIKGIRFINIDSATGISNDTLAWFKRVLSETTTKVVILTHKPCIPELNFGANKAVANYGVISNGAELLQELEGFAHGVLAYFHGHTHCDNLYTHIYTYHAGQTDEGSRSFPFISIASSLPYSPSDEDKPTAGTPMSYSRTQDTITEFCMDIVAIDPATGGIKTYRFGVGNNRTYPIVGE